MKVREPGSIMGCTTGLDGSLLHWFRAACWRSLEWADPYMPTCSGPGLRPAGSARSAASVSVFGRTAWAAIGRILDAWQGLAELEPRCMQLVRVRVGPGNHSGRLPTAVHVGRIDENHLIGIFSSQFEQAMSTEELWQTSTAVSRCPGNDAPLHQPVRNSRAWNLLASRQGCRSNARSETEFPIRSE